MNRTAIVTGAGSGIGAAIAGALGDAGYRVGVLDHDEAAAARTADTITGAVPLTANVTDEEAIEAAFDTLGTEPDLLVCNAGIVRFGKLGELSVADFRAVIEVNLIGAFVCARAAVRRMAPLGRGHVIGITSTNAYSPGPGSGAYPASKSGVAQMMKQFALEYGGAGLRFNSIAPGFIDGGMSTPIYADRKVRASRAAGVPLGRLGTPDDIAAAVVMLDDPRSAYITGIDLLVDGGVSHAVLKNLPRE